MKTNARVVVIGGGIAGCSVLYHLTKLGWTNVILVEKGELASGTTWHSVGAVSGFADNLNFLRLRKYSVELYRSLEAETGQGVGFHQAGSLRLAVTPELLKRYKANCDMAELAGVPCHIIGPREAVELNPLISDHGVLAAVYVPGDGHVDPTSVTVALARGAQQNGAEIYRNTFVMAIRRTPNGEWQVVTDKGVITTEIVVNAAGQWANEVARMVDARLPVVALEHQYAVTGPLREFERSGREIPLTTDPGGSFYHRQEGVGLLFGFYESEPKPWCEDRVPWAFKQQLLPPDTRRIEAQMLRAVERLPVLADAEIKRIVNGPDAFTPDGKCLMGFAPGLKNFFVLTGFSSMGISSGGGAGKCAAEWIVQGEPSLDMADFDVLRFGDYAAAKAYVVERTREHYATHYGIRYPHAETSSKTPLKTSALYHRLKEQGAVYGVRGGWERPLWFAPGGVKPVEEPSFHRANWFEHVGAECRHVREGVGVLDQSSLGKIEVWGPGATVFVDGLCTNTLPAPAGRIAATLMLNERGGIESLCTVARVDDHRFWLITAASRITHDIAWLTWHLPSDGSVAVRDITHDYGCLAVMGPRSRDLLQQMCDCDLSNDAFPFLTLQDVHIGAAPVRAYRLSCIGELGWELYHSPVYQTYIYERLMGAGHEFALVNFGYRASDSLRMEKAYPAWGTDITSLDTPLEAALGHLVSLKKGNFPGRAALIEQRRSGSKRALVCLTPDAGELTLGGWEPVLSAGKIVGHITSGQYGYVVKKAIALAYVPVALAAPGTSLEVKILGERYPAIVVTRPLYDPNDSKVRQ